MPSYSRLHWLVWLPLTLGTLSSQPAPLAGTAKAEFAAALVQAHDLGNAAKEVNVLSEGSGSLRVLARKACLSILDSAFASIIASPEKIELSSEASPPGSDGKPPKRLAIDRDVVFRRFIAVASRVDSARAAKYIKTYSELAKSGAPAVSLWSAALDLLDADIDATAHLASLAAASTGFPDPGLLYLERLRTINPGLADSIAATLINKAGSLAENDQLALLSYLLPYPRVPEFVDGQLVDRDMDGQTVPSSSTPPVALLRQFVDQVATAAGDAGLRLSLLRLAEHQLSGRFPDLQARIAEGELRCSRSLALQQEQRIFANVDAWLANGGNLAGSIDRANLAFEKLQDQKYRDRANLLKALSLAKSSDYTEALELVSTLPADSRAEASDAVLLYAANSVRTAEAASQLAMIARQSTHSPFVVAYTLLRSARLRAGKLPEEALLATANELHSLAQQTQLSAQRFTIQLGAASLLAGASDDSAFIGLASLLKDVDEHSDIDGLPSVHLLLTVAGTSAEFNISAGDTTLYSLVRTLAKRDLRRDLSAISGARRDDVRLRCIVAASSEYLMSQANRKTK